MEISVEVMVEEEEEEDFNNNKNLVLNALIIESQTILKTSIGTKIKRKRMGQIFYKKKNL